MFAHLQTAAAKAEAWITDVEGSVDVFTRMDAKNRQLVPCYHLKESHLKPFRYGVVRLSHLQMVINPLLLQLSRSVGCALPDQFMVSVTVKVHEKQSINEELFFVQL